MTIKDEAHTGLSDDIVVSQHRDAIGADGEDALPGV